MEKTGTTASKKTLMANRSSGSMMRNSDTKQAGQNCPACFHILYSFRYYSIITFPIFGIEYLPPPAAPRLSKTLPALPGCCVQRYPTNFLIIFPYFQIYFLQIVFNFI